MVSLWLLACGGDREARRPGPPPPLPSPAPTSPPAPTTAPLDPPSLAPDLEVVDARALPVPTAVNLPLISGFTVNARIHPHGLPTRWRVEFGDGLVTADRALPGQLTAHFAEDWSAGASGWNAGFLGALEVFASGGPAGGPFVRYTDEGPYGNDTNHYDGIGLIHLGPYAYLGNYYWADAPPMYLGGGFPDLRGARLSAWLRGVGWEARGTELGTWIQSYRDPTVVEVLPYDSRYPNWAHTADPLTPHLASGVWERAEWTLRDRTADWTFAGAYGGRLLYDYGELDRALAGVNVDLFAWQVLYCDLLDLPSGSIDTADFALTYRQHSLLAPSNGGALVTEPGGGVGADLLTDGWRFGDEHEWRVAAPGAPQVFEWAFERPVVVTSVNVVNASVDPSREVRVSVSDDGGATWVVVTEGELPASHGLGANYAFHHADAWTLDGNGVAVWAPLHDAPVDHLRLEILSGWGDGAWALGEVEAFGTGALEATDDAWYDTNQDILVPPGTYMFRVIAENEDGVTVGWPQIVAVP